MNGTWFLWAVALHSVAIGAALLEHHATAGTDVLAAVAVISWSVGVVLYVATAVLVMMRLIMLPVESEDIDPPFWILMGLSALVVVAGSHIVEMTDTPLVDDVRGLVAGLLVPVMVALGVWRHGLQRVPLRYTPALWSIVFPLGMFAASGMTLGGGHRPGSARDMARSGTDVGGARRVGPDLPRDDLVRGAAPPGGTGPLHPLAELNPRPRPGARGSTRRGADLLSPRRRERGCRRITPRR